MRSFKNSDGVPLAKLLLTIYVNFEMVICFSDDESLISIEHMNFYFLEGLNVVLMSPKSMCYWLHKFLDGTLKSNNFERDKCCLDNREVR